MRVRVCMTLSKHVCMPLCMRECIRVHFNVGVYAHMRVHMCICMCACARSLDGSGVSVLYHFMNINLFSMHIYDSNPFDISSFWMCCCLTVWAPSMTGKTTVVRALMDT